MTVRDFSRCLFGISAATAMLAGCGASQPPTSAPGAVPQTSALNSPRQSRGVVDAAGSNEREFTYVADYGVGVIVYSYRPSRIKYVGLLSSPQESRGRVCR